MIEKLTEEQKAKMAEYRDKWIKIGLSTEPANRKEAEYGVNLAYKLAGLPPPEKIVWCSSPLSQGLTRAIVLDLGKDNEWVGKNIKESVRKKIGDSVWDSVWDSVRDSVRDSVWASVWDSVGDSVWDSVRASVVASVWDSVWDSVRASVWDSVMASVWDSVGDSVWDSVRASVWDSVRDSVMASGYGQHDAGWLAFYEYFKEACGLDEQTKKLAGLWQISKNAGWFLPHAKICWISERHNELSRDERGRLHNETGMALSYPDGWGIYALHGVRVPEKYILTPSDKIDPKEVLKEKNSEIRMAVLRKVGFERFLKHLPHKVISETKSTRHPKAKNRLLEIEIENTPCRYLELHWKDKFSEKTTFIGVARSKKEFQDNTDENFAFSIPNDPDDCEQVRRWTMRIPQTSELGMET